MTAPYQIGYWVGNRFVIPGLPQAAAVPAPTVPATNQQDVEAHQATTALANPQQGFAMGGQGGPGMERDSGFANPMRTGGAAPAPGQDTKDMGGPRSWGSTLGTLGGIAGMAIPGIGGALLGPAMNLGGSWIDARAANNGLASQGLGRGVSAGPAALSNGLFGLLGALGVGQSIGDQVSGVKNEAWSRDWATPPNLGFFPGAQLEPFAKENLSFLPGVTFPDSVVKDGAPFDGGNISDSSSGDGTKADPGKDSDVWGGGTGGTSWGYAKGGTVQAPPPGAADPPGPDDQIAAVQTGEGVLTKKAMKKWPGLLDALNKGDAKKARGLLG